MLEQVLGFIHNYFEKEILQGTFTVAEGAIGVSGINNGQYFRIVGSTLNDGVYQYPTTDLSDEEFDGEVWLLAIPRRVIELSEEIAEWEGNNSHSPFMSESFGGYSYSRGSNSKGMPIEWRDVFGSELNQWRKII